MVIMQPSLRIVMMTSEMTGSVKATAWRMSPVHVAWSWPHVVVPATVEQGQP